MADVAATIAALEALRARLSEATRLAVADIAHDVQSAAQKLAPVRTGTLRRSIYVTGPFPAGPDTWAARVGPTVIYGRIAELGGHIYPVRAKALRWYSAGGQPVFAMHVYHRATPYMKPGFETVEPSFDRIVAARIAAAIEEV